MLRVAIVLLAVVAGVRADTAVTLKRSAVVGADGPVFVGDVAEVSGDNAPEIGRVALGWGAGETRTVEDLRRSLTDAGVNWGRVTLTGSRCVLRAAPAEGTPRGSAHPMGEGMFEALVRERIAAHLEVEASSIRVEIEGMEGLEVFAEARAGRTLDLRPLARGDRIPVRAVVYEGDRVVESRTIRARVLVYAPVWEAKRDLPRGAALEEADLARVSRWVAPSVAGEHAESPCGGRLREGVLRGGEVLASRVRKEPAVRRGDVVVVDVLAGSFKVEMRARARAEALAGDVIELETLHADRRERRVMTARVSGPGRAVRVEGMVP